MMNEKEKKYHSILANYFHHKADPQENNSWEGNYPRGFTELLFHLQVIKDWSSLADLLTHTFFLHQYCQYSNPFQLDLYLETCFDQLNTSDIRIPKLLAISETLGRFGSFLRLELRALLQRIRSGKYILRSTIKAPS